MPETVRSLRCILCEKARRCMTIVADRDGPVTGLGPGVKVLLHYVAVRARARLIRQIRIALCINERVAANSDSKAYEGAKHNCLNGAQSHRLFHESISETSISVGKRRARREFFGGRPLFVGRSFL